MKKQKKKKSIKNKESLEEIRNLRAHHSAYKFSRHNCPHNTTASEQLLPLPAVSNCCSPLYTKAYATLPFIAAVAIG